MENIDDVASSGRVTRSIRKRLTSVDCETSTSQPTTPLPGKLSTITELNSPSRPVRMTRRNSTSAQATPIKTPLKGRTVGLRSDDTSNTAIYSPKRSKRQHSFTLTGIEETNGGSATAAHPKFDTLPKEDVDEKTESSSQSTSLHEQSAKRPRGRPGPKSRTRKLLESDTVDSDVEIINLEDDDAELTTEIENIQETISELIEKEKRKSVGNTKMLGTINLVNDDTVMGKEDEVNGKQIEKNGALTINLVNDDLLKDNKVMGKEDEVKGRQIEKPNVESSDKPLLTKPMLCSSATKIMITKVETLESLSPDKLSKYVKNDSFESSKGKKNSFKSVAFNNSEYDNSMKATYPKTPGRTKSKSYIEVDSSKETTENKSFQSDKGSVESFQDTETHIDQKYIEKYNASKESVEYFDASNVVGEEEVAMDNLLISNKTPQRSKMLMKQLQSSTPVVETIIGALESKRTMSQKESKVVDEVNDAMTVQDNDLDASQEKSLRSGKRYGSVSPSPSATKSCVIETQKLRSPQSSLTNLSKEKEDLKSPKNSSKEVEGMSSPMPLPKKPSTEKVGTTSPKPSLNTPSKEDVFISSPKPVLKSLLKEDVAMSTLKTSKVISVASPKPTPKNQSKEGIGMTTPKLSQENPSKEEVGMAILKSSSKKKGDLKSQKLSPINSAQKLNLFENIANISTEENKVNCKEKNDTESPYKGDNDSIPDEKNSSKLSFSKSWSQGVSGTVNKSTKIDTIVPVIETITTEVDSKLGEKNSSMKKQLRIEFNDEINDVGVRVSDIENEEDEEEPCEINDFFGDEAEEAEENYCSGDSMNEDERRQVEDNKIPINDAESIGSEDTEEDEYDEEESEEDSFIATDEEFQLDYSIEDDNASTSRKNFYKRIILQSSTDESENGIDDDRSASSDDNDTTNNLESTEMINEIICKENHKSLNISEVNEEKENEDLNEQKKSKRRSLIKAISNEAEDEESLIISTKENLSLNESQKSKRRSSIKTPGNEIEHDDELNLNESRNKNIDLNMSKKSKRKNSVKPPIVEIEPNKSLNKSTNKNIDLNDSKKRKRRSSIKTPVDETEHDETNENVEVNGSKRNKNSSLVKASIDEIEHDESLNKLKNNKSRSSIKTMVEDVEQSESLNNVDLNESKKIKRRTTVKALVEEIERNESLGKSTNENVEHAHNDSESRKSLKSTNSVLNARSPSDSALPGEIQEEGNKGGFSKTTHVLEVGSKEKTESVEKFDILDTKRKSVERRKSTSDSDYVEEAQSPSGKRLVRRAPISQSLEMQRKQEYQSSSDDDEESENEKLFESSSKQKFNEARKLLRRSKLYDNESSGDNKMREEKSLNVSKSQLKCANRESLKHQKSEVELVVTSSSSCDDEGDEYGKGSEQKCASSNEWRKPLGKPLNKSLEELDAGDIEENNNRCTSKNTEIHVSKQKFIKSLNDSKKRGAEPNIASSCESEIEDVNVEEANQFSIKSLLQRSLAVDGGSFSPAVAEKSSSICANEKSKRESLKSSGLSVSFGEIIKEKKKSTAGGKVTHSSFTVGVSVTKNGESDEQGESSEQQDEVSFVKLGNSDSSNEFDVFKCKTKSTVTSTQLSESYQNSTPHGFKPSVTTVSGKRFVPDEPGKLVDEIKSKIFEDANCAALEKKTIENNSKLKLHNKKEKLKSKHSKEQEFDEIFVPLVSNKEQQKHNEEVKLALEQALKASANIILNYPGKKKQKHLQKIDEGKIDRKRLHEEILEAVAHTEHKSLKNKHNDDNEALYEDDRQHVMKINSGDIVETPLTPPPSLKRKRSEINKFKLATGVVREEQSTPKREKVRSGFRESPITPRTTGFKVRQILTAGQDSLPTQRTAARKNRKRKRSNDELRYTLPKPKWSQSGMFIEEDLSSAHSVARTGATQFIVSALRGARKTAKRTATSSGGSASPTAFSTASANALNFKNSAMFRDNILRESSQQMLQRKERHRMHNQF